MISLEVYTVVELQVKYLIQIRDSMFVAKTASRPCLYYDNKLYISKGFEDNVDYIAIELSKIFGEIKGLEDFIISIFEKRKIERIENLMVAKGIQELPGSERDVLEKPTFRPLEKEVTTGKPVEKQGAPVVPISSPLEGVSPPAADGEKVPPEPGIASSPMDQQAGTIEEWEPECSPREADVKIELYEPKKAISPHPTEEGTGAPSSPRMMAPPIPAPVTTKETDLLSGKVKKQIGEWGEEHALECLKIEKSKEYQGAQVTDTDDGFVLERGRKVLVKVVWLNKQRDRGIGHDIELIEDGVKHYIEVKSTETAEKEWFDLSKEQWKLMQKEGDKFWIYRVYAAGTKNPRLLKIANPAKLWREGSLPAHPVRVQI